jgi:hypothetical protein
MTNRGRGGRVVTVGHFGFDSRRPTNGNFAAILKSILCQHKKQKTE